MPIFVPPLQPAIYDGVTFARQPEKLLAPLRLTVKALGLDIGAATDGRLQVSGRKLAPSGPALLDGTRLIPLRDLQAWDVAVVWDPLTNVATLTRKDKTIQVRRGPKRVQVDKAKQELRAFQGELLVLRNRVSTGGRGHTTPNGNFTAGPYKARMHRSRLYNNAPMPYSTQIHGNIFFHGYSSVPRYPASHGCVRMPLNGPAQFLFDWIESGTAVSIEGTWRGRRRR